MQQTIVTAATCRERGRPADVIAPAATVDAGKATVPITSAYCHVLGGNISRVTDIEGLVARVICPAHESPSGFCRIRRDAFAGGPLSQLLERVAEDTLDVRSTRCDLQ